MQKYSKALQLLLSQGIPMTDAFYSVHQHEVAMCRDIPRHCSCCWTMARCHVQGY